MHRLRRIIQETTLQSALFYGALLPVLAVCLQGVRVGAATNGLLRQSLHYLGNSFTVSLVVTALSVTFGFTVCLSVWRLPGRGRKLLGALVLLPLINPPFVGSIAYIMLFGKRGLISHGLLGLELSAYGYPGIVVMQTLSLTTLAYILLRGSVRKLDPDLEDAARNLGASEWHILTRITLPLMRPELTAAATMVFLASMADFGTPLIIGGPFQTLASKIYLQITGLYDLDAAAFSGAILLLPCLVAFFAQKHLVARSTYYGSHTRREDIEWRRAPRALRIAFRTVSFAFAGFIVFKYLFIVLGMFTVQWGYDYTLTLQHVQNVAQTNLGAFANSIQLSFFSALGASGLGIWLSYLIKRGRLRAAALADLAGTLPAAVPGILFGIGYLLVFRYPLLGAGRFWLGGLDGIVLLGTGIILYVICIFRYTNVGLRAGYALLEHQNPDIEDAARTLGAGEGRMLRTVVVPLMLPAFESAFLKNFSTTMTTLGAIIFLILPSNKVAIQQIFQMITSSETGVAAGMAVSLSLLSGALMLLFQLLFRLLWRVR